tara:strand:- start:217 stop:417 length:201 start_codon:yes stop_codon:yes gene_type:complete
MIKDKTHIYKAVYKGKRNVDNRYIVEIYNIGIDGNPLQNIENRIFECSEDALQNEKLFNKIHYNRG